MDPKKAATVILIRKIKSQEYNWKLLLVKRYSKARFMANICVFPGGVFENSDEDPRWCSLLKESAMNDSISNKINAIRETFEETGILCSKENRYDFDGEFRKIVQKDPSKFYDLFEKHKMHPDLDLKEWCVIVTPKVEKYRYHTNFYLKIIEEESANQVLVDNSEVVNHFWLTPSEAIREFEKGSISLAPPTWTVIKDLTRFKDWSTIYQDERCLDPILPNLSMSEDGFFMVLPGDKEYEAGYSEKDGVHRVLLKRDPPSMQYFCKLSQKTNLFKIPSENISKL